MSTSSKFETQFNKEKQAGGLSGQPVLDNDGQEAHEIR